MHAASPAHLILLDLITMAVMALFNNPVMRDLKFSQRRTATSCGAVLGCHTTKSPQTMYTEGQRLSRSQDPLPRVHDADNAYMRSVGRKGVNLYGGIID